MKYETLLCDRAQRVATITINRPEAMNALTDQVYRDLIEVLAALRSDEEVGCLVITGAGRAFCAGADLKARRDDMTSAQRKTRHEWILREFLGPLVSFPKPVIAAVNGVAVGAGTSIALAADIVLTADVAAFVFNFVKLGLVPDLGGYHLLTRAVGISAAKEIYFSGRRVEAAEAQALGLALKSCPLDQLLVEAQQLARDIAALPPMALASTKGLINRAQHVPLGEMFEAEALAQTLAYASAEFAAAVNAFRKDMA